MGFCIENWDLLVGKSGISMYFYVFLEAMGWILGFQMVPDFDTDTPHMKILHRAKLFEAARRSLVHLFSVVRLFSGAPFLAAATKPLARLALSAPFFFDGGNNAKMVLSL